MRILSTVAQLDSAVGARPATAHLKSIAVLDRHCLDFLAASTFSVLGVAGTDGHLRSHALGGEPGHLTPAGPTRLGLPSTGASAWGDGPAGLVSLVPGYSETLRINGRVRGGVLEVEEAFLHCAKCVLRSELWGPTATQPNPATTPSDPPSTEAPPTSLLADPAIADRLARARFVTVTSVDGAGHADVSPKGDPAGFVSVLDPDTLAIPDRPGNRRTDTFRNLLERPDVSLLAFIPGGHQVVEVHGTARVSDDEALRAPFAVRGKAPKVVMLIEGAQAMIRDEPAIAAARLWDPALHSLSERLPRPAQIFADHVRLNDDPGLTAKLARAAMREGLMSKALDADYRKNLY